MFWNTYSIDEDKIYYTRIGPLEIWIKQHLNDWYITYKQESFEHNFIELTLSNTQINEDDFSWNRWVLKNDSNSITLKPVMPDKPFIIRPKIPIKIPSGNSGKFFVNIPVWVRIEIGNKDPVRLCDLPIHILSKSWFGTTSSGELCYSKKSLVRRSALELEDNPCSAICSVKIKNNSKLELNFERFCLNTENLSIFSDSRRLCTNHVDVIFCGEDQESQIAISKSHSDFLKNCKLISSPRKTINRNILKMSFQYIKTLTGF